MDIDTLSVIAVNLTSGGRGILAIDESTPTCNKRFDALEIDPSEENRRSYRELLVAGKGLREYVSGAILFDETIRQTTTDGQPIPDFMTASGITPGIKVDTGAKPLAGHSGELVTEGLDGLRDRLVEYHALGARFAKWRAVITIGQGTPTRACIEANAHALARYAALCQESQIVPIVEPEVLMEGTHSIEVCYEVTAKTLASVFEQIDGQGVALEAMILKPNMVISGLANAKRAGRQEVAAQTLKCLRDNVPEDVSAIAFLSGGQGDIEATEHLNLMNQMNSGTPWPLTFSYGRALQREALETWSGQPDNVAEAQAALLHRARLNAMAALGTYTSDAENAD